MRGRRVLRRGRTGPRRPRLRLRHRRMRRNRRNRRHRCMRRNRRHRRRHRRNRPPASRRRPRRRRRHRRSRRRRRPRRRRCTRRRRTRRRQRPCSVRHGGGGRGGKAFGFGTGSPRSPLGCFQRIGCLRLHDCQPRSGGRRRLLMRGASRLSARRCELAVQFSTHPDSPGNSRKDFNNLSESCLGCPDGSRICLPGRISSLTFG